MNEPGASVTNIAKVKGRDYITPEDISEALKTIPADRVRLDVLAVLGGITEFGAEDKSLCAFVAHEGTPI